MCQIRPYPPLMRQMQCHCSNKWPQQVKVPIQPPANHVTLEKIPSTAVLNVPLAVRVRLVLNVKIACRVNTVRVAIQMLLRALIVPLVLVKVTQGKRRAFPAVPVNSTMLLVLRIANNVLKIRTTATKKEIRHALAVP